MNPTHTRLLFRVAALFNVGAVLLFLPQLGISRAMGLSPVPTGSLLEHVALGAVLLFGIGYWMAASTPEQNRAIIQLGLAGKVLVVGLAVGYYIAGAANLPFLGVISGDLVFSVLFAWYLISTRATMAADDKEKPFVDTLWDYDEKTLIKVIAARKARDTGDAHTALTVLQAKAAVAAKDTAKSTRQLAYATFALAALTLALVLVEVFDVRF